MATTSSISTAPAVPTRALGFAAVVSALAGGALANFGNLTSQAGEEGGTGPFLLGAAAAVALAALLFGLVVPRAHGAPRTALVLAVLAVVSLVAVWAGLPFVFGFAAIAVALAGERSAPAKIALVLAGLAIAAGIVGVLFG
jgi:hypothetical protein